MPHFRRASPGQPLIIRASEWNERSRLLEGIGPAGIAASSQARAVPLPVLNAGDTDIPAYGIAAIDAAVVDPAASPGAFVQRPALRVVPYTEQNATRQPVVAANKIPAGGMGTAIVAGVTPLRINVLDDAHEHATPSLGVPWELDSSEDEGPLRILYREPDISPAWAYGLLGGGGSGGAQISRAVIVYATPAPGFDFAYVYTCAPVIGGSAEPYSWVPDDDPAHQFDAFNTAERIGFSGFTPSPIAQGVGVLVTRLGDARYFSMANVEGACANG
ncbi:MAG: hypothetical protein KC466_21730 [Myxococcales bacterium]|nr:hypothetical protein [Myxococcales bacterium]